MSRKKKTSEEKHKLARIFEFSIINKKIVFNYYSFFSEISGNINLERNVSLLTNINENYKIVNNFKL